MMESTFRQELQRIGEADHLWYTIAMLVWFHWWRQEHGSWPSLPACGPGPGHYWNLSSICHLRNQNDPGGEASLMDPDHSPIPGRSGPEESTTWTYHPMHSLSCSLCSRQRSHLYLMLYWDMLCWLNLEVPQSKLTYHAPIYPHYHPVWVQLGTCLNMLINFDLVITSQPWGKWHWTQWTRLEQQSQTSKQSIRIQGLKLMRTESKKSQVSSNLWTWM